MKIRSQWVAFGVGLLLLLGLLNHVGLDEILPLVRHTGWRFGWIAPYFLLPTLFAALSWKAFFCAQHAYPLPGVVRATWVGLACNWLLPVAQVGGEIAKARMLSSPSRDLIPWAAMILDKTFQLVTQCCFGALGLTLLLAFRFDQATFRLALAGIGLLSLLAFGFWRMQRRGLMTLGHRWIQKILRSQSRQEGAKLAQAMDARVSKLYLNRIKLLKGFAWRMCFRFAMAGEVYLIMGWMGHPVTYVEAVIFESLGQTVRMAGFIVPAGLGIQEGALTLIGAALGVSPAACLSLSVGKRLRECLVGGPALLGWFLKWRQEPEAGDLQSSRSSL